jgi:hypothetical protein
VRTVKNADGLARKYLAGLVRDSNRPDAARIAESHVEAMTVAVLKDALEDYYNLSGAQRDEAPPAAPGMPEGLVKAAQTARRAPPAGYVLNLSARLEERLSRAPEAASQEGEDSSWNRRDENPYDNHPPAGPRSLTDPLNPLSPMSPLNPINPLNPASPLRPFGR